MNIIYDQIHNEIVKYDKIIIHRHMRYDYDCIGAQSALFFYLKQNFPNKQIINGTYNDPHNFKLLPSDEHVTMHDYKDALIIVVDTANFEKIDSDVIPKENTIIKIDHHPDHTPFGNISLVEADKSATCEVLNDIFISWEDQYGYHINRDVAKSLICGIYADTGGFSFSNTKENTFKALSNLMKYDVDYNELVLQLSTYDEDIMRLVGYAYQNLTIENKLGYIVFDKQFQKENNISAQKISLIANFLWQFNNLEAWVVFNEYHNFIRVNLRSKHDVDISLVAQEFGGGGHKNASGANLDSWDKVDYLLDEVRKQIN